MLPDPNWFRNLSQALVAQSFAEFFKKPLCRSLFAPLILRLLEQLYGQLHMGAAAFLRLADESADDRFELRRQFLLKIFVALPRSQRLFLRFL